MKKSLLLLQAFVLMIGLSAQTYQPNWESLNKRSIPKWFHQDKFGIFIHWGTYAVPAYAPVIPTAVPATRSGIGGAFTRDKKILKPFTIKTTDLIINTPILKKALKPNCLIRLIGLTYLKNPVPDMLYSPLNITRAIAFGTARTLTAPGAGRGMQLPAHLSGICLAI
jgi:hypothetical protein